MSAGNRISRFSLKEDVTLTTDSTTTPEIRFSEFCGGSINIPSGSSITTLTWYGATEHGGTYVAAQDADGNAITQTVAAGKGYPLPIGLFGYRALRVTGDAAGAVEVSLKG